VGFLFSFTFAIMEKFLIVGLGNIGVEYHKTRHNIGFDVADALVHKHGGMWLQDKLAFRAEVKVKNKLLVCIKPTTYMNLSGRAVKYWLDKEKIAISNMLVLVDELALPLDTLRLKGSGSDGGHNGLKDIQLLLNTTQYPRLRFGIGADFAKGKQADFVLSAFKPKEEALVALKTEHSVLVIELFVLSGIAHAMNYCNGLKL
jgi:peptidyl-tRNA hydrolase, PTH1 family